MQLEGKTALVTGAASDRSIGWGIAKALAQAGADVAVNDIDPTGLADRVTDLMEMGRKALALPGDVSDSVQVEALIERLTSAWGKLDIAVANAGIIRWERFFDITPKNLRAILAVNIVGTVNVCRAAAGRMVEQGNGGRIIMTSSVQADTQFPITPVYGASKHAMHIYVGSLALELAPFGITVNHIGPGWVRSPLNDVAPDQQSPASVRAQQAAIPLGRDGTIEEMGAAALYFASPAAAYTTGAFLRVDGGLGIGIYN